MFALHRWVVWPNPKQARALMQISPVIFLNANTSKGKLHFSSNLGTEWEQNPGHVVSLHRVLLFLDFFSSAQQSSSVFPLCNKFSTDPAWIPRTELIFPHLSCGQAMNMLPGFLIPSVVKGLEVFLISITVSLSHWPSYSLLHVRSETTSILGRTLLDIFFLWMPLSN